MRVSNKSYEVRVVFYPSVTLDIAILEREKATDNNF